MEGRMAVRRYKSRKSLKEPDEFVTLSSRLMEQVVLHKNKVITVLSGIVVIGLIMAGTNYLSKKAENSSFYKLNKAVIQYESAQKISTPSEACNAVKNNLEEISGTYANKMGGKLANFYLANCRFAAGEFSQAEALYRKAVKDFDGEVPFELLAKSSLGYSLEQQGKHEEAAVIFSEMPTDTGSLMGDESLFALCRQYGLLGNTDQQLGTAKKLIETYPQSIYVDVLKEKFPGIGQSES
jgi:tetratricopeptide (TPR) repeat protein